jgi:serine/threonine protein phosphatase 1
MRNLLQSMGFGRTRPWLPDGLRVYAVGDVHGRRDLLERTLRAIDADVRRDRPQDSVEIFLGDLIDRGPDSRGVIDVLSRSPPAAAHRVCLCGNHEERFLAFLDNPAEIQGWREFGGFDTLYSYGVAPPLGGSLDEAADTRLALLDALPEGHRRFLQLLPDQVEYGSYLFVHAGIDPARPLDAQRPVDLRWIREPFLSSRKDFGRIVVHGHTPVEEPEVLANRINIDTGAYVTGRLTCLVLERGSHRFLRL